MNFLFVESKKRGYFFKTMDVVFESIDWRATTKEKAPAHLLEQAGLIGPIILATILLFGSAFLTRRKGWGISASPLLLSTHCRNTILPPASYPFPSDKTIYIEGF